MLIRRKNWGFHLGRDICGDYTCVVAWGRKAESELSDLGCSVFRRNVTLWPLFSVLWYRWQSPWGKFYDVPIRLRRW